jgi:single-strand DNA-binding protein
LQTRKWTDKDGNEKYTTEVVLQGFNSSLTMLDGRGGGGGGASEGGDDFGASGSGFSGGGGGRRQPAMAGGGKNSDMGDDEIPF